MKWTSNGVKHIGNLESFIGLWIIVENKEKLGLFVGVKENLVGKLRKCKEWQHNLHVPKD